jgi:hypothetical protein
MAHGYLGDGYGAHGDIDPDREYRERRSRERGWRDEDWRERDHERDRGSMFGEWDRGRLDEDRWTERGFHAERFGRERSGFEGGPAGTGDFSTGRRTFSAHPDDHYRSWRDRHMSELDRDYADYCREREQQFHSEFENWRRQKRGNPQPLRTGMTQSGMSHDPSGMTQAAEENSPEVASEVSATGAATLGTNSEGRTRGRR